ncbi:MAG: SIS domain-containing protein, partial [Solirubrobacterales bacterium]
VETLRFRAAEIATELDGTVPVIYGADVTAPVARRWKTQANENAKVPAFAAELPEADHNELCGWTEPAIAGHRLAAVFLEDRDQHPRVAHRFDLTAKAVSAAGAVAVRVETAGETRIARLLWATMLGDLVSLELAGRRGVDPVPVEAIERFKEAMGR